MLNRRSVPGIEAGGPREFLPEFAFFGGDFLGRLDLENDEEIAASTGFQRQSVAANPETLAALGTSRDFDLDGAGESGDGGGGAENGFPWGKIQFVIEGITFDPKVGVGCEPNAQVKVAGSSVAGADGAVAG